MILALATTIAFGTCEPVFTEWTVTYADGEVMRYATTENRLEFIPRPGLRFSIVQCQQDVCSAPQEFVVDPLPGDATWDGCIGLADFLEIGDRFGQCVR